MEKIYMVRTVLCGIVLLALSACGRTGEPVQLDRFTSSDGSVAEGTEITVAGGTAWLADGDYRNFILTGKACMEKGAEASLFFHTDGKSFARSGASGHHGKAVSDGAGTDDGLSGYEVIFRNGPIDGTRKTGSLAAVRNLYRSLVDDTEWFTFVIAVREKNIVVSIDSTEVVCYTEPEQPYRMEPYRDRLLGHGRIALKGVAGKMTFSDLTVTELPDDAVNPCDTMPVPDEQNDSVIRLQQRNFPVIDYHVHLKGGLTKEMAHAMSMNYGINYGVAPNAGEGGVGRMLADDDEVAIRKVLEWGADGVVIPHCKTAEMARRAVEGAKFYPLGRRGGETNVRAAGFGYKDFDWNKYIDSQNENTLVIPMDEDFEFTDNIDEILSVPGVDAVNFGPIDYAVSKGLKIGYTMGDDVKKAFKTLVAKAKEKNIGVLGPVVPPTKENLREAIEDGYTMIILGNDMWHFQKALRDLVKNEVDEVRKG